MKPPLLRSIRLLIQARSPYSHTGADARRGGEGIVSEDLAGVGLQVGGDFGEENRAVFGQLFLAHAADPREFVVARGVITCHLPQGHVGKDDVGGQVLPVGRGLLSFQGISLLRPECLFFGLHCVLAYKYHPV